MLQRNDKGQSVGDAALHSPPLLDSYLNHNPKSNPYLRMRWRIPATPCAAPRYSLSCHCHINGGVRPPPPPTLRPRLTIALITSSITDVGITSVPCTVLNGYLYLLKLHRFCHSY